ncbi:hypothetical protein C8R45DRAFT_1024379 [Mycena sanguinolenta]|nr:hypothetical protein C8R45DRAFT_1024379 [Mycena sanguinolenta]
MTYHEWRLTYDDFPLWIRPATGQLCVELSLGQQERDDILLDAPRQDGILRLENISLDVPNAESLAISSLDERKYHHLCSVYPMAQFQRFSISPRLPIWYWPTLSLLDFKRRALLMVTKPLDFGPDAEFVWEIDQTHEALPKSWMRFDSRQAYDLHLRLSVHSRNSLNFWLAQANYIFSQLQTTSNLDDYVFVYMTTFRLRCLPKPQAQQLQGYLFICPPGDIRTGENSCKWPDCPAYWSLDPSGAVPLSSEDAKTFGFPIIHIETLVKGYSWDDSVYQGLQQFHTGKGFDPDSQDMARDLGYPLFELSTEEVPPLAYGTTDLNDLQYIPADRLSHSTVEGGLEEGPWHCDLEDPARCQALGHYV